MKLNFVSYKIEDPIYNLTEAIRRDMTYALPIRVKFSLEVYLEGRTKPEIREEETPISSCSFELNKEKGCGTFFSLI